MADLPLRPPLGALTELRTRPAISTKAEVGHTGSLRAWRLGRGSAPFSAIALGCHPGLCQAAPASVCPADLSPWREEHALLGIVRQTLVSGSWHRALCGDGRSRDRAPVRSEQTCPAPGLLGCGDAGRGALSRVDLGVGAFPGAVKSKASLTGS